MPLFIATERFDPSDGDVWRHYCQWAKMEGLTELVGLDGILCRHIVTELALEDWDHVVREECRLDYFYHLDHLRKRVCDVSRRNILGLYRNPEAHIETPPGGEGFTFMGYDLIDEETQISALTNCGGYPDVFANDELIPFGLIRTFDRAFEIKRILATKYPDEAHAQCELYAIWRLNE